MLHPRIYFLLFPLIFFSIPCLSKQVKITLLQANDVYEMTPVNGGMYGGLARVETILKTLKRKNRYTYSILAGDLISPSAIGTAKVDGKRINGQQMIDVLNAMEWDYFTLGNHEFDNGYNVLVERLVEAKFKTVSTNVLDANTNQPFVNTVQKHVFSVKGVTVGLAGITLKSLSKDFVTINDPFSVAKNIVTELREKDRADIVILITHQEFEEDVKFAEQIKGVDLILGGHEHENVYARRGVNLVPISKADANARSVYIHELNYDTKTRNLDIVSHLKIVDESIKEDKTIKRVVDGWVDRAFNAFEKEGFEPRKRVCTSTESLDGLEASVRNGSTKLTDLVAQSAILSLPGSTASLYNAGSIRIDDVLPPGAVTQYDVIRILPFSDTTFSQVEIPGDVLKHALTVGLSSRGTGAFLQTANIDQKDNKWYLNESEILDNKKYTIAISTFLIDSGDVGLEFLVNNASIKRIPDAVVDARRSLIKQLQISYPDS